MKHFNLKILIFIHAHLPRFLHIQNNLIVESFLLSAFTHPIARTARSGNFRSFDRFLWTFHDNLDYQFEKFPAGMYKNRILKSMKQNLHDDDKKLWLQIFNACDIDNDLSLDSVESVNCLRVVLDFTS